MKKVLLCLLLLLSVFSCNLPILRSGQADLEFSLGGVLPNISNEDLQYAAGSRAITPNSLMVQAVITGEGFSRTYKAPVLAATTLIAGLPAFKELTITLEALDFEGIVTTSWTGKATLNPGRNSLKAIMKPVGTTEAFPVGMGGVIIPFGKAQFYKYTYGNSPGESLVYVETGNNERLWMGVYNENWEPLETITESRGDGWAVINLTTHPTVYFAIANMRNTGYPPGEKNADIIMKNVVFTSPTGSPDNSGTSASPWDFSRTKTELGEFFDTAFFIASGAYDSSDGGFSLGSGQWVFGGFDPSDWKKRSPGTTIIASQSNNPAVIVNNYDTGVLLDGLAIRTDYATGTSTALSYTGSGLLKIINCTISGTQAQGVSSSVYSTALSATNASSGFVYVYGSKISGGSVEVSGNHSVSLCAVDIQGPTGLIFLFSDADGGSIKALTADGYDYNMETSAILVNVGSDMYTNMIISASRVWGGSIQSNMISPRTTALGFSDYSDVVITSSVLSAGYIKYLETSGNVWMTALSNYSGGSASLIVAGSVLDSGYFETSSPTVTATGYEQQSNLGTFAGSVFITNNASFSEVVVTPIYLNGTAQPALYDCAFIGPVKDAYNFNPNLGQGSFGLLEGTELRYLNALPDVLFASYVQPVSASAFFTNSWRPAGLLSGLKTSTLPSDWGMYGEFFSSREFLLSDLGNRLRSRTDFWTIGPYQN